MQGLVKTEIRETLFSSGCKNLPCYNDRQWILEMTERHLETNTNNNTDFIVEESFQNNSPGTSALKHCNIAGKQGSHN